MAIRFDDYLAKLPATEQRAVAERAAELIAEEKNLRQSRDAREQSREEIAKKLQGGSGSSPTEY